MEYEIGKFHMHLSPNPRRPTQFGISLKADVAFSDVRFNK